MDKLLGVIFPLIEKFIPNKNEQLEFQLELMKLNLDDFKEKKGIVTRIFHLVFPIMTLVLTGMYVVEFYLRCKQYLLTGDWITVSIVPSGMELLVLVFLSLLMPKKILEVVADLVVKYVQNKFKK